MILNNLTDFMAAGQAFVAAKKIPKMLSIEGLGEIYVRGLTLGEIDDQVADTADKNNKWKVARGATRLVCNDQGVPLMSPDNEEHVALWAQFPLHVLTAINDTINPTVEDSQKGN